MTDTLPFRLIDAFADQPYMGNPAGVLLDADGLDERQMQLIAREINASETAFVANTNSLHEPPRLRWFSPTTEVGFCGHATLATAHAWAERVGHDELLAKPDTRLEFQSAAGRLALVPEKLSEGSPRLIWWLAMPDPQLTPDGTNPTVLATALTLTAEQLQPDVPVMRTRDDDLILIIRSWRALAEMRPNMLELRKICRKRKLRGVCVSTADSVDPLIHATSRFFAPAVGIDEDPVTGSVHGPLATLLVKHNLVPVAPDGQRVALHCMQGIPGGRSGVVRVLIEQVPTGKRISIGGICQTTLSGQLTTPK